MNERMSKTNDDDDPEIYVGHVHPWVGLGQEIWTHVQ